MQPLLQCILTPCHAPFSFKIYPSPSPSSCDAWRNLWRAPKYVATFLSRDRAMLPTTDVSKQTPHPPRTTTTTTGVLVSVAPGEWKRSCQAKVCGTSGPKVCCTTSRKRRSGMQDFCCCVSGRSPKEDFTKVHWCWVLLLVPMSFVESQSQRYQRSLLSESVYLLVEHFSIYSYSISYVRLICVVRVDGATVNHCVVSRYARARAMYH